MKPNLGLGARYMRTALGLTALTYASSNRRKASFGTTLLVSVGAMKVAEGITGWCPMQYLSDKLRTQTTSTSQSTSTTSPSQCQSEKHNASDTQEEGKSEILAKADNKDVHTNQVQNREVQQNKEVRDSTSSPSPTL